MYKSIIKIPKNIQVSIKNGTLFFKSSLAEISLKIFNGIQIKENQIHIFNDKKPLHGLMVSLIKKKIKGIYQGFKLNLYLKGIGYKALFQDNKLILKLGFSHDIVINKPNGIDININKPTVISLSSNDWVLLTQFASSIKQFKPAEPYKGKGILFKDEIVLRKEGKKK